MVGESNYIHTKRTEEKNLNQSATIKTMVAARVANSTTASTTVEKDDSSKLTCPVSATATTEEAEISQTTTKVATSSTSTVVNPIE
jgi:hypothetical protein